MMEVRHEKMDLKECSGDKEGETIEMVRRHSSGLQLEFAGLPPATINVKFA